jgi:hypothetical protein
MWSKLNFFLTIIFFLFLTLDVKGQVMTTSFVDPCTKAVTEFTIPIQGSTIIYFYGQQRSFTATDVSSGAFSAWINQVYSDYRKISPCSVQSLTVTRNQVTSQIIGNTVSSVVGSIMSQVSSAAVSGGGSVSVSDAASKGNNNSDNKSNKNGKNNNNNSNNSTSNGGNNGNFGNTSTNGQSGGQNNGSGGVSSNSNGGNNTSNNSNNNSGNNGSSSASQTNGNSNDSKGSEVNATTTMNVDARNDKGDNSSGGGGNGGSKKGGSSSAKNNPIIVSSDLTSAQNLDKSFTGIMNIGMSQSSVTGASSWGLTGMVWFNFKQFALSSKYSKIHFSKNGKLKLIHNLNLTGLYTYGNYMGFLGYSAILNAGKFGITGGNISTSVSKVSLDKNLFLSPSITAFYTKPFRINKKLIISPEIYIISTPLVYSSVDKITVSDRTFSGFLGSGFDYQLSKRFKVNINYKLNASTNKDFPILSFFLIGSKVNL